MQLLPTFLDLSIQLTSIDFPGISATPNKFDFENCKFLINSIASLLLLTFPCLKFKQFGLSTLDSLLFLTTFAKLGLSAMKLLRRMSLQNKRKSRAVTCLNATSVCPMTINSASLYYSMPKAINFK